MGEKVEFVAQNHYSIPEVVLSPARTGGENNCHCQWAQ